MADAIEAIQIHRGPTATPLRANWWRFILGALALTAAWTVFLGSAGSASASRPPTAVERAALSHGFPARCLLIRVSTVNPAWAGTKLASHPQGYCEDHNFVFDGGNFFRRQGETWKNVLSASDAQAACARIPRAVLRDLAAIAGAVGCSRAPSAGSATFQSPSGNIVCRIEQSHVVAGGGIAACLVRSSQQGAIVQGGKGLRLGSGTITNPTGRILAYGNSLKIGAFGCSSTPAGMTCRNSITSHGFFASRAKVRLF
jgi:hypothetical protein